MSDPFADAESNLFDAPPPASPDRQMSASELLKKGAVDAAGGSSRSTPVGRTTVSTDDDPLAGLFDAPAPDPAPAPAPASQPRVTRPPPIQTPATSSAPPAAASRMAPAQAHRLVPPAGLPGAGPRVVARTSSVRVAQPQYQQSATSPKLRPQDIAAAFLADVDVAMRPKPLDDSGGSGASPLARLRQLAAARAWDIVLKEAEQQLAFMKAQHVKAGADWREVKVWQVAALIRLRRVKLAQSVISASADAYINAVEKGRPLSEGLEEPNDAPQLPVALWVVHAEMPSATAAWAGNLLQSTGGRSPPVKSGAAAPAAWRATMNRLHLLREHLEARLKDLESDGADNTDVAASTAGNPLSGAVNLLSAPLEELGREDVHRWRVRVLQLLASHAVAEDKYELAVMHCGELQRLAMADVVAATNSEDRARLGPAVVALCRAARVMLQMGNVTAARKMHDETLRAMLMDDEYNSAALRLERALLLVTEGKYETAMVDLAAVLELAREDNDGPEEATLAPGVEDSMLLVAVDDASLEVEAAAVNNFAACALHCCELQQGIQALEAYIKVDPAARLMPTPIFNLCTLYDLVHSPEAAAARKHGLRLVTEQYHITHLDKKKAFRL